MNEQALKARLKYIAKEQSKPFNEVWKLLLLERFLARLAKSKYSETLIFKGGLLLSYYVDIRRETIDIDLLAHKFNSARENIISATNAICAIKLDDNFKFSYDSIDELDHIHMNYPGYRIKILVEFDSMTDKFHIDIGVGDIVEPTDIKWPVFEYKGLPLYSNNISLQVYPAETIFSEKLETLISRGPLNSRMKDYHDLLLLVRNSHVLNSSNLQSNIKITFNNRGTKLELPIIFSYEDTECLNKLWQGHRKTLGTQIIDNLQIPQNINSVVEEINKFLSQLQFS